MSIQVGDDFTHKLQHFLKTKEINYDPENKPATLKPGAQCPVCMTGILDYDGTLNLICEQCGEIASIGGACT